ncbi:Zn-dependent hydrolase [Haloplanus ruber]|uniref:Zn-dependent hydrolase n=1 Tax=Haloplanus ruber TaxID=869892 RepID=A0ABD6CVD6_9EURY|nr:Zn-dependent hydrolase [Haloplanus ruber]
MIIDESRLQDDIETTAAFGTTDAPDGHGRTVLPGTPANQEARDYLVSRMEATGLDVRIDAVGNIAGRWVPDAADADAAPVATGSHLDSVPNGGIFDGPLGVYAALEAVRALESSNERIRRPIEVVSFTGEEGSRFPPLLGSSVAVGTRDVSDALAATDADGVTLREALEGIGYAGDGVLDASSWDSWFELHIEQGRVLEHEGVSAGVVSAITGIMHGDVRIDGEANHAGTTAMLERQDALAAAAEFILDVERAADDRLADSESVVGTVGRVDVAPNATNVVPGTVEMGVDVRDVERDMMDAVEADIRDSLDRIATDRDVETRFEKGVDIDPVPMDERCRDALRDGAAAAGIDALELSSGAGHDTMHVASVTDAGLLFVPSRGGISHNPAEWTDWQDCAKATEVLAQTISRIASDG